MAEKQDIREDAMSGGGLPDAVNSGIYLNKNELII